MFKVGDIVECREEANQVYSWTIPRYHWVGRVTIVYDDTMFEAVTIESDIGWNIGYIYDLESRHFKLQIDYPEKLKNFINSLSENVKH